MTAATLDSTQVVLPLEIHYGTQPNLADDGLLAVIGHQAPPLDDPRAFDIGLPQADGPIRYEIWRSALPVLTGRRGDIHYAATQGLLFARLFLDDDRFPDPDAAARHGYRQLLELTQGLGYPRLLRVWHYLADINREHNRLERYRAFCRGRHEILAAASGFETALPAASALGGRTPGLRIHLLAAPESGRQIENPRQVSAFRYPRRYGPRSPAFSRALLKDWGGERHLYLSGTASIVGHRSRHIGQLDAQVRETLRNLDVLMERGGCLTPRLFKVYLRPGCDPALPRQALVRRFGPVPTMCLWADICRSDLLVEIEGLAVESSGRRHHTPAPSSASEV